MAGHRSLSAASRHAQEILFAQLVGNAGRGRIEDRAGIDDLRAPAASRPSSSEARVHHPGVDRRGHPAVAAAAGAAWAQSAGHRNPERARPRVSPEPASPAPFRQSRTGTSDSRMSCCVAQRRPLSVSLPSEMMTSAFFLFVPRATAGTASATASYARCRHGSARLRPAHQRVSPRSVLHQPRLAVEAIQQHRPAVRADRRTGRAPAVPPPTRPPCASCRARAPTPRHAFGVERDRLRLPTS